MPDKKQSGPPTFGGGRYPVEQDLGTKDTSMQNPTVTGSGTPEHTSGVKFGSNLVEEDKSAAYNPKGPPSPGIPTHMVGKRFGGDDALPDKTPAYNPGK